METQPDRRRALHALAFAPLVLGLVVLLVLSRRGRSDAEGVVAPDPAPVPAEVTAEATAEATAEVPAEVSAEVTASAPPLSEPVATPDAPLDLPPEPAPQEAPLAGGAAPPEPPPDPAIDEVDAAGSVPPKAGPPSDTKAGTTYLSLDSGDAWRVEFIPGTPDEVFCTSFIGFTARSTDGGRSWSEPLDGGRRTLGIQADPASPGVLWTVRVPDYGPGYDGRNYAILRSTDSGARWVKHPTPLPLDFRPSLFWHPADSAALYFTCFNDPMLFKSSDSGLTWTPVANLPAKAKHQSLCGDAADPRTLWVWGGTTGVCRSTDAGVSWAEVGGGLPSEATAVAAHPVVAGTLFAGVDGGLWKSTDGGDSWSDAGGGLPAAPVGGIFISRSSPATVWVQIRSDGRTSRDYYGMVMYRSTGGGSFVRKDRGISAYRLFGLAIHPADANKLACGTTQGIHISSDGGETWSRSANTPSSTVPGCLAFDPVDPHCLYLGSSGLHEGHFGDLHVSQDGGATWRWSAPDSLDAVVSVAVDPAGSTVWTATKMGVHFSTDRGRTWTTPARGHSGGCLGAALAPGSSSVLYSFSEYGGVSKSTDGGRNWGAPGSTGGVGARPTDIDVSPASVDEVILSASEGPMLTTDGGLTWKLSATGLTCQHGLRLVAYAPSRPAIVYAGARQDPLPFRSTDGGRSWAPCTPVSSVQYDWVSAMAVDPHDPDHVFAGTRLSGLFRTTDGGLTWVSRKDPELDGSSISLVAFDPHHPGRVFWGNGTGLHVLKY